MEETYTPLYYNGPTQVKYYDIRQKKYHGGIAYRDFIISGIGEVLVTDLVVRHAYEDGIKIDDAVIELEWLNIDGYIWTSILEQK